MRPSRRALHVVLATAASSLVSALALAAPTARLVYVRGPGAESCAEEGALKQAVAARLGYDPFRVVADTTISVDVRREARGFSARTKLVDADNRERGARELRTGSDRCDDLIDAVALSVSLAIDPLSLTRPKPAPAEEPSAAPPAPEPAPAPAPEPAPAEDRPPPPPPAPADKTRSRIGLGVVTAAGIAPSPSFGGVLAFDLERRPFELQLRAIGFVPSGKELSPGRFEVWLAGADAAPCVRVRWLAGCATATLAAMGASSKDVASAKSEVLPHVGLGGRIGADMDVGTDITGRIALGAQGVLFPTDFKVGGQTVYSSSPIVADLSISLLFSP